MYRDKKLVQATAEGAAISAALALVEHIALWQVQDRVPLVARYTLGTAAILIGLTHTARRLSRLDLAAAAWTIAATTGAVVTGAHRLRRAQPDTLDQLLNESGDANGLWVPRARRAG